MRSDKLSMSIIYLLVRKLHFIVISVIRGSFGASEHVAIGLLTATDTPTDKIDSLCLAIWLNNFMTKWLTDWLNYLLTDWLTSWLTDWLPDNTVTNEPWVEWLLFRSGRRELNLKRILFHLDWERPSEAWYCRSNTGWELRALRRPGLDELF